MPSSSNRKRIEIPSDLYDRLSREAEQHGVPVSALATFLLLDALNGPNLHPTLEQRLDEILTAVRELRAASTEQHREMRNVRDEIGETREYMLLQFPEGMTDILSRNPERKERLRGSRQRLIEQLRGEHWRDATSDREAEVKTRPPGASPEQEAGEE